MDLDALLSARESDGASGENLEYDFDFMELQRVAAPGEERQAGNEIIAGEEPDFRDVEARALAILERSHDLRAAVILGEARLNTKGVTGFADAVAYIRRCLEEHWDTCHPELDADDDNDPTMRVNALRGLAAPSTVLRYLRRVPLTQSRTFGRLTLMQIQQALGEVPPPEGQSPEYDRAAVSAAFADTDPDMLSAMLTAARQTLADLKTIDRTVSDRAPGTEFPIDDLIRMVQAIVRHLGEHAAADGGGDAAAEAADAGAGDDAPVASAPRRMGGGAPGVIETANDARAAIDRVIDYFRKYEPSSPVPIILERAKRLVGADFMAIMKDMAPKGLENVRMIGGLADDDDD